MAIILRRLPVTNAHVQLTVPGGTVTLKPYQILVWVSLLPYGEEWDPRAPKFPALVDTAHNHNFFLQEEHLRRWAGIVPQLLEELGHISVSRRRVPLLQADVWLHPNIPGSLQPAQQTPYPLTMEDGIAVYPDDGSNHPRLPLLGLRAILDNELHLAVSGWRSAVTLRTRRHWWFWD